MTVEGVGLRGWGRGLRVPPPPSHSLLCLACEPARLPPDARGPARKSRCGLLQTLHARYHKVTINPKPLTLISLSSLLSLSRSLTHTENHTHTHHSRTAPRTACVAAVMRPQAFCRAPSALPASCEKVEGLGVGSRVWGVGCRA